MQLILKNISKIFNSLHALQNFSCVFTEEKTSVLIGSSGCGKSTILRLIAGLVQPNNGHIEIDGNILSDSNLISVRKKLGYVIQDGGLFPHLSAYKNISLMASYIGWDTNRINKRIEELSNLTKFPPDHLNRFPAELSGGQKQRVSLMRALMLDPELLLLDEPLGALDPLIRFELQDDLKDIFNRLNKTVLLVTHDLNEAIYFADEIFLIKDGMIIQNGNVNELINSPAHPFVTQFINAQRSRFDLREQNK